MNIKELCIQLKNEDELPAPFDLLAKEIGIENTLKTINLFKGLQIYFTTSIINNLELKNRNEKIKKEFDGGNYKSLAIKYGVTERWIRKITE